MGAYLSWYIRRIMGGSRVQTTGAAPAGFQEYVPGDAHVPPSTDKDVIPYSSHSKALERIYDDANNSLRSSGSGSLNSKRMNSAHRKEILEIHARRVKIRRLKAELKAERNTVDELIADLS